MSKYKHQIWSAVIKLKLWQGSALNWLTMKNHHHDTKSIKQLKSLSEKRMDPQDVFPLIYKVCHKTQGWNLFSSQAHVLIPALRRISVSSGQPGLQWVPEQPGKHRETLCVVVVVVGKGVLRRETEVLTEVCVQLLWKRLLSCQFCFWLGKVRVIGLMFKEKEIKKGRYDFT